MFSIVVPLYNKEKSIFRAISSILKQNLQDFELIIVNDGSTDNSIDVLNEIEDNRIIIVNKPNGGVSSARNFGIEVSKFDWICFLDADDYWKPNHLDVVKELINKYPSGSIYSTLINQNSEKGIRFIENSLPDDFEGYIDNYFKYAFKGTIFHSSSVCIKKESLVKVGCFDTSLKHGEDLDLWFKLMIKNRGVVKKESTVVYDLLGENRAMLSKCDYEKHLVSKINKYRSSEIPFLNDFIDFFILRNSVPYFFSDDKIKTFSNLTKMRQGNKINSLWKYVYSDYLYRFNFALYKIYKKVRVKT
jgi:glycosyltransferase involved in cell wall biosynthesis